MEVSLPALHLMLVPYTVTPQQNGKWGEFACPRKQYEDRTISYLNLILRSPSPAHLHILLEFTSGEGAWGNHNRIVVNEFMLLRLP